jgi:hypothetical protein
MANTSFRTIHYKERIILGKERLLSKFKYFKKSLKNAIMLLIV